jgi:hypothetical protein
VRWFAESDGRIDPTLCGIGHFWVLTGKAHVGGVELSASPTLPVQ